VVIPVFNESNVLPPFSGGSPALPTDLSPYTANMCEVIARFGGTPERKAILVGLLNFRQALRARGLTEGFQWIDGSFVENVEVSRGRPPADIDLVTFVRRPEDLKNDSQWASFVKATPELFNPRETKRRYLCDAYLVDLDGRGEILVENTKYWFGLFSHQRETSLWKGMLKVPLCSDDDRASELL